MESAVSGWVAIVTAIAPVLISLIGIIPTIISNRRKTQDSIEAMQKKVTDDIKATKREVSTLQTGFDTHVAEEEEHRAKQARYRFLRFYDEMCEGRLHSESHFEDILEDCDFYERYCADNPAFRNSRGTVAIEYIKECYGKLKKAGGFLTHPKED